MAIEACGACDENEKARRSAQKGTDRQRRPARFRSYQATWLRFGKEWPSGAATRSSGGAKRPTRTWAARLRSKSNCEVASMSLSPIGNPAWKTVRGVRFAMQYGASLVAILVTNAALDEMELVPESGYLERFNKHRHAIEKVASSKHQRGQIEESGVVVVQAADMK